jgi:N-acetylglucosamine transport system permease protein
MSIPKPDVMPGQAGPTISILPVLAVYLVFHKQISTGTTAGALR